MLLVRAPGCKSQIKEYDGLIKARIADLQVRALWVCGWVGVGDVWVMCAVSVM